MAESNSSREEINQKEYYDRIALEYDTHYASSDALKYRTNLYDSFLKGQDFSGMKVLDAMCGGGQSTYYFKSKGAEVTGIDISEAQCALYQRRFPNNPITCASILGNKLSGSSFDLIVTDSVHHTHPEVDQCLAELHRLLKPGGLLLLWEPSAGSIIDLARKLWYRMDTKFFQDNEASIDLPRLERDQAHSFKLEKFRYGGNVAYLFNMLTMATRLGNQRAPWLYKLLDSGERVIQLFQSRATALWFIALFRKI